MQVERVNADECVWVDMGRRSCSTSGCPSSSQVLSGSRGPSAALLRSPLLVSRYRFGCGPLAQCPHTLGFCTGAVSDASTSKYRRRYWVVASTIVLVISTLTLAYCREIAAFFVDLFGYGGGSWDPKYSKTVSSRISSIMPSHPDPFTP